MAKTPYSVSILTNIYYILSHLASSDKKAHQPLSQWAYSIKAASHPEAPLRMPLPLILVLHLLIRLLSAIGHGLNQVCRLS